MKVFNYRCDVDVKIKCIYIYLNLYHLVYFDLYDTDGDHKITKKDLKKYFNIINTKDENDIIKAEANQHDEDGSIESYIDPMISILMKELISNRMRHYIDFSDFRTLMWNTNIDKTCVIYLEEE